jgi:hypothetical protein
MHLNQISNKMSLAQREQNYLVPQIHSRFKAKDKDSDDLVNYIIQDLPEERFEDGLNFMLKYFPTTEPMLICKKIAEDEVALKICTDIWRDLINKKVSLACFREGSDEIVGMNVLHVDAKETHKKFGKVSHWIDEMPSIVK